MNKDVIRYMQLLGKVQEKRVICGFNEKNGEAIVTTGIPRKLNDDKITYIKKQSSPYEEYIDKSLTKRK